MLDDLLGQLDFGFGNAGADHVDTLDRIGNGLVHMRVVVAQNDGAERCVVIKESVAVDVADIGAFGPFPGHGRGHATGRGIDAAGYDFACAIAHRASVGIGIHKNVVLNYSSPSSARLLR
jgi:hypothetical protein